MLSGHYIRYTLQRCPFTFRNAFIPHGTDSTKCWKHSTEILLHFNMIGSCRCLRFVSCAADAKLWFHHIPKVLFWPEIW